MRRDIQRIGESPFQPWVWIAAGIFMIEIKLFSLHLEIFDFETDQIFLPVLALKVYARDYGLFNIREEIDNLSFPISGEDAGLHQHLIIVSKVCQFAILLFSL